MTLSRDPRLELNLLYPRLFRSKLPYPVPETPTYYTFLARNAIYHGLRALNIQPGENILVPSFHCASAIEPILKFGAQVKFYNIHRDCSPDFGDIQTKIDQKTRALLAIHYFGFSQPIQKLKKLCSEYGLFLIEDCAHVLTGSVDGAALGSFGDISIFSWRKFFPIYDGGLLVINNPRLGIEIPWERNTFLFNLKTAKNTLEKIINISGAGNFKKVTKFLHSPSSLSAINNYDSSFNIASVNFPMSDISKCILRNSDIPAVIHKRRLNAFFLLEKMSDLPEIAPFFKSFPENICPLAFPVLARDFNDFHMTLRAKGVPAFTWSGVIHPSLSLEEFPEADFLYKKLILLPIHQSLGQRDMQMLIKITAEALRVKN